MTTTAMSVSVQVGGGVGDTTMMTVTTAGEGGGGGREPIPSIQVIVQQPSPPGSASELHMQLLSVPLGYDGGPRESITGGPVTSADGGLDPSGMTKPRRYSCNTPSRKGSASGANSPSASRRRSSLAAGMQRWTAIARRFSMGMSHDREPPEDPAKAVAEVNNHVAQFRDLLIHIGQSRDGPEMREKIRRMRRLCIDSCRHAVHLLLQQVRSDASEGIPVDYSPQLVLLFFCTQLLHRELRKCRRLVMTLPIDMTAYYAENRPGPSSLGGVLSQIILCRQLNPDFNQEELCSIDKDTIEISDLLDEMQEFMPKENTQTLALAGEDVFSKWARRRRKKSMYCHFGSLCCVSKSGRFTV